MVCLGEVRGTEMMGRVVSGGRVEEGKVVVMIMEMGQELDSCAEDQKRRQ